MTVELPRYADTLVLGGGTAGAAVAGLIAERSDESVLVLEAGPDYGPLARGAWPRDLLDARDICDSHSWDYSSGTTYADRTVPFQRARVIGGCSSHNGCAAIWGHRLDYDGWAAAGNDGWSTEELLPFFRRASDRMRVRIPALAEVQPFQRAFLEAAPGIGIPVVEDLNDLDEPIGMAPSPANIHDGVRWNAALAYLDPVREKSNLTIRGEIMADRLLIERGRVVGAVVVSPLGAREVRAGRVVVAAGSYGSPGILLRSGIGDADELKATGIAPVHHLPGVGRNLHDHPAVELHYGGTPELIERMRSFLATSWTPEEQTIAKARSSFCREAFDIHLYPVGSPYVGQPGEQFAFMIPVACMTPRSRGRLHLTSADCSVAPLIDHGYLTDAAGADREVLVDAVELARAFAAAPALRGLIGEETAPGPDTRDRAATAAWVERTVVHYYHPAGSCKMGPVADPEAVVDPRGKIHGLDGCYVADCSIMPVVPRANTNIPAVVVGERIASILLHRTA